MNPALLAAINKGGGKKPTKVSKKDRIKTKRPPRRADQKQIEKTGAPSGRVVGKNYKPKPGSASGSSAPNPQTSSNPSNNALLGNILAARKNMKKSGSKSSSTKSKPATKKSSPVKKWGSSKKSDNSKPQSVAPKKNKWGSPKTDAAPKKKWGSSTKTESRPSAKTYTKASSPKTNVKAPDAKPHATNASCTQHVKEIKELKAKIATLEKEKKELKNEVNTSRSQETKLMEKIVSQQNDYNKLLKEHKLLKQAKGNKVTQNTEEDKKKNTTSSATKKEKEEDTTGHKKKESKWNIFGKKDKNKESQVENTDDVKDSNEDKKASKPKQVQKKVSPPKAGGTRKKPLIPKDVVAKPSKPPKPVRKETKAKKGSSSSSNKIGKDVWNGYIKRFGNAPTSASQLQSFSKSSADFAALNFKQAREVFSANNFLILQHACDLFSTSNFSCQRCSFSMTTFFDDEDAIPLKSRNYSDIQYNMDSNNEDDSYGTFDGKVIPQNTKTTPADNADNGGGDDTVPKLISQIPRKQIVPIRTDRITGSKYRQVRSIPFDNSMLAYEKEVYNSSKNMYQLMPRNESLASIMRDQSSIRSAYSAMKDVCDQDTLDGYEWLGKGSPFTAQLAKIKDNVWHHNESIALLILALLVTIVAFIISQMTSFCWGVINYVYTNNMYNEIVIFLACLVLKCGFVFAAIFFTITTPQTAGSGIPELKAILSGIWIRRYLSIRGFFIKTIALICALGSGLPIGIEGPVIHISAIIGRQLTKISMFQHIERKMLLSAACACGIAVIFSAPIGGVLFSIEVTHHYYKVESYWSAFVCATFAALFTIIVQAIAPTTLQLLHTSFEQEPYQTYELIIFMILGAISGLLGAAYVQLHRYFTLARPKIAEFHNGFWNNSYILAGIVTSSYVLCAFILGEFAFQPSRMAISDLFNAQSLSDCSLIENHCNFTDWSHGFGVYWNLFCFSVLNYLFSICFLVLDWPCGCFASVFAIGAATGRLLGEILNSTIMNWSETKLLAATYAVVGAASLVGGVTRTFSVAVIVIEMTLSVELSVPVLIGVIISWTIASWLSDSLYDSILNLRGIPLLPITPKHITNYSVKPIRPFIANDFMVDIKQYGHLNDRSSFKEIVLMLQHSNEIFFPIISKIAGCRTLLGEISRQILEEELTAHAYGKYTEKRRQLIRDATQTIQALSMYSLRSESFKTSVISTEFDSSEMGHEEEEETMISIVDNEHFGDDDDKEKKKKKDAKRKRQKKKKTKRKWDESGYLKRKKSRIEWIDFNEARWIQHMNISPVTVIPTMPITQIYILFHVLHPDKIYVAKRNEIVGVLDEQILLERERLERNGNLQNEQKPNKRNINDLKNKNHPDPDPLV